MSKRRGRLNKTRKAASLVRKMKAANIESINQQLLQQTGIDFSRYRNQQLAETLADAISFPVFFARSISRPVAVLVVLTLVATMFSESGYFQTFLVFPGLLLAVVNGLLLGLVLFIRRIRNDMTRVFSISSDLCVQVLRDIKSARTRLTGRPGGFPSLGEIFHGVNAVVILPMLIQVLRRKVPFLGSLAAGLTERFFKLADKRLAASIQAPAATTGTQQTASPEQLSEWFQTAERLVNAAKAGIAKVVNTVSRVVAFPFITVFVLVLAVSAGLTYGAYTLLA